MCFELALDGELQDQLAEGFGGHLNLSGKGLTRRREEDKIHECFLGSSRNLGFNDK